MLVPKQLSTELFRFIKEQQQKQLDTEDIDVQLSNYCEKLEELIYRAIKSATITVGPQNIIVTTPTGPGVVTPGPTPKLTIL